MSELTPQLADEIRTACEANAADIAGVLGRAIGTDLDIAVGTAAPLVADEVSPGGGLAVIFSFGDVGLVALLSESSGLVPGWCHDTNTATKSRLGTLAQELSTLIVPPDLAAEGYRAHWEDDLPAALKRAKVSPNAAAVSLNLSAGENEGTLQLIWPLARPRAFFADVVERVIETVSPVEIDDNSASSNLADLPSYSRSLLKVNVPVSVVLATKKETVHDVVELAPGTIIKFAKSCDEPLNLYVGNQMVAEGEAVKVGDKFGFRVTAMTMPTEHFLALQPCRAGNLTAQLATAAVIAEQQQKEPAPSH